MAGKKMLLVQGDDAPVAPNAAPERDVVLHFAAAAPVPTLRSPDAALAPPSSLQLPLSLPNDRVRVDGKFLRCGQTKWLIKGLTYGPFAPDENGIYLPPPSRVAEDFAQVRALGGNAIRVYHTPPRWLLDEALRARLRVLVDVPWEKHRCFLEDYSSQQEALRRVREAAALGDHPALLALSVVNEIPRDVVRFYGTHRVEQFIGQLIDAAKQRAPECLLTYTNYPPTEFLRAGPIDFLCFNVYIEDPEKLGAYLDRLHHLAGPLPLVLGEHGMDSLRHGPDAQARSVAEQVARVFRHGLAGSFVFSYTDDWFAGGAVVEDWAFGMTDRARQRKPAAEAIRRVWEAVPFDSDAALPKVSVVVCSYNGAATLDECLRSLSRLRYPDYEVILVDDGSTDDTAQIAARFPEIVYIRQSNLGLSAARNVGARRATGEIVAYTDSDCVADEDWLNYLVHDMLRQDAEVIGGPNIPPPSDCNIARCVALSPGGPSHVMLDDHLAEHVPGCNMAFRREKLLALGGFDDQFRQAGDDVDICWRFIDAGARIGYAPAAVVWHHRRSTVRAYLRQQAGYGRSEAMLYFKHPHRFNAVGNSLWSGVIYGEGATGLAWLPPVIYHGRFGAELFPAIYRSMRVSSFMYFTLLEWHALALFALLLSLLYAPMALVSATMWLLTLLAVVRAAWSAPLDVDAPRWSRPLVGALHLLQPIVRSWHRNKFRLMRRRLPRAALATRAGTPPAPRAKSVGALSCDLYWTSEQGIGRETLLEQIVQSAAERHWPGDFHCHWDAHDLLLMGDRWHELEIRTATEELGGPRRFTRARVRLRPTGLAIIAAAATTGWAVLACAGRVSWAQWIAVAACAAMTAALLSSRRNCRRAVTSLLTGAAQRAGLQPVVAEPSVQATSPPTAATTTPNPAALPPGDDEADPIAHLG